MGVMITPQESSALYELLAEQTTDIIIKTDCDGFIRHVLPAGAAPPELAGGRLEGCHLLDLVDTPFAPAVMAGLRATLAGRQESKWVEFRSPRQAVPGNWFGLRMRRLLDEDDRPYGAVGIIRSIAERRSFEERLFAAAMTDPLTGLTNRSAFSWMLQHMVEGAVSGCLAMFDIDHFKAINLKFGHAAGDDLLVVFADLVKSLTRSQDIISRIGGESFGVLLPHATSDQAEAICRRIVTSLAEACGPAGGDRLRLTVSAGLAPIEHSLDATIKRAELALAFAKARGRNRVETASRQRSYWQGSIPGFDPESRIAH